jgi:hypothetical protein
LPEPFPYQVVPELSGIKAADLQDEHCSKDEETMRFEVDGSAFANVDDEIEIGDDVRRGDIVWFDRISPQE